MPMAIPLIAAAASAYAGAAAFAAATTMVGMITSGMMIAGAAMTAIGTISGNQKLTKWGGIVSLAGGVGNILAGMATNTATAVGEASAGAAGDASSTASSGLSGSAGSAGATGGSEAALSGTEALTPVVSGEPVAAAAPAADIGGQVAGAASDSQGLIGGQMATSPGLEAAPITGATDAASVGATTTGSDVVAAANPTAAPVTTAGAEGVVQNVAEQPSVLESLQNFGSKASTFAKNNKEVIQAGAGLVKGAMEAKAQGEMLDERARLEEEAVARQRARLNASVQGLRMPTYQRKAKTT